MSKYPGQNKQKVYSNTIKAEPGKTTQHSVNHVNHGEIYNLVYSVETSQNFAQFKTWLSQGKTKNADLSSHSGSPRLATKDM